MPGAADNGEKHKGQVGREGRGEGRAHRCHLDQRLEGGRGTSPAGTWARDDSEGTAGHRTEEEGMLPQLKATLTHISKVLKACLRNAKEASVFVFNTVYEGPLLHPYIKYSNKTGTMKYLQMVKSRDITLPTKVHVIKTMVFPVGMYGCKSWTIKKAEH